MWFFTICRRFWVYLGKILGEYVIGMSDSATTATTGSITGPVIMIILLIVFSAAIVVVLKKAKNTTSWEIKIMNNQNIVANIIKIIAVIFFIIIFIGGIVIGYNFGQFNEWFGFLLSLATWIVGFIFCVFIYAIGEIISLLQKIVNNTDVLTKL